MSTRKGLSIFELVLLPVLGVLMFVSKLMMEFLPNIHLVGMLVVVYTLVYRWKALIPIYVYVFLLLFIGGLSPWWVPNLYTWTVLWGLAMLLPRSMPGWLRGIVYPAVCAFHGLIYGALCAPTQALMYGMDWHGMVAWIVAGLAFDLTHCVGNLLAGLLILPMVALLRRLHRLPNHTI